MVWILKDENGKYLECFERKAHVIESARLTFHKCEVVPQVVEDDDFIIKWDNGFRADHVTPMDRITHL